MSLDVGTYYLQQLQLLRQEFSIVGDVRGKGLMIGIEFVQDKVCYYLKSNIYDNLAQYVEITTEGKAH